MTPDPTDTRRLSRVGRRRLRAMVIATFALAFVAIAGLVAAGLWLRHDEVVRDGRGRAENLVAILAEDLAIRVGSIEEALRELAAFSRFIGGPTASGQEWMTLLRTVAAGRQGFEALMVTDANGRTTFSSLPIFMGESQADGKAFGELSQDPRNDALIADDPERSSNDSKLIVPLARVIRTPNAEFEGMAIANFAPDQLRAFYRTADVGENGIVWLLKPPDAVLVREPPTETPDDESWPSAITTDIDAGQSGVTAGALGSSGLQYVTAYRSLVGTGLTIAVSLAYSDLLAPWWREVYAATALTLLVGLILLVAATLSARTMRLQRIFTKKDGPAPP